MAGQYLMPHNYHLVLHFWCILPIHGSTKLFQERTQQIFAQIIWWLHDVPLSHCVSQQRSWAGVVLHHKSTELVPAHQHASVCAACRTARLLYCTTALLVLQPKHQTQYNFYKLPFTKKADLGIHILQMCPHTWQDQYNLHDSSGHMFALKANEHICAEERSNMHHNPMRKLPTRARKETKETWYWVHSQSPQESSHQEALQPLQETWGCIYHAQHKGLL